MHVMLLLLSHCGASTGRRHPPRNPVSCGDHPVANLTEGIATEREHAVAIGSLMKADPLQSTPASARYTRPAADTNRLAMMASRSLKVLAAQKASSAPALCPL